MRLRLPGLALSGLLLLGTAGALAQAEAERRLDAAIERLRATLGPDAKLQIGRRQVDPVTGRAVLSEVVLLDGANRLTVPELALSDVSDTRIGRAEAMRVTYRGPGNAAGEAARILVAGLPLPPPAGAIDLTTLAFAALEVEGARVTDPARGNVQLARLALRDWTPAGIGGGTLEGFDFRSGTADGPDMQLGRAALEAVTLPVTLGKFDPAAFRATRLMLEGAALRDPTNAVDIGLARLALAGWVPGRLSDLAAEGVRLGAPAGAMGDIDMRLARATATGMDLAGITAAVATSSQLPDPVPGVVQRLLFEGLEGRSGGQPLLTLARLATEGGLEAGVLRGGLVAEGFRLTPPPSQAAWLAGVGYSEVAGGFELRGSMPRDGGRMEVAPLGIAWNEAAALRLTATVEGMPALPAPGQAVAPEEQLSRHAAARLGGLVLSWRDEGLLGRVIAMQARQQRIPESRLREQWAQMALAMPVPGAPPPGRGAPQAKGGAAASDPFAPIREALASFIRRPGTLEITLAPPKPIPFMEMAGLANGGPAQLVQVLGLSVVAR
jgi:hypothetical protein